jgi:hypothetical protein
MNTSNQQTIETLAKELNVTVGDLNSLLTNVGNVIIGDNAQYFLMASEETRSMLVENAIVEACERMNTFVNLYNNDPDFQTKFKNIIMNSL